jgi:hypothetical protein
LRAAITPIVEEISLIPDLRLLDIVLWTSQDDRLPRRPKQGPRWDARPAIEAAPLRDFMPVPTVAP